MDHASYITEATLIEIDVYYHFDLQHSFFTVHIFINNFFVLFNESILQFGN